MGDENWHLKYGMLRRLFDKSKEPLINGIRIVKHHGYRMYYPWACPEICSDNYRVLLTSDYPNANRVIVTLYSVENNQPMAESSIDGLLEAFIQAVEWLDDYEGLIS